MKKIFIYSILGLVAAKLVYESFTKKYIVTEDISAGLQPNRTDGLEIPNIVVKKGEIIKGEITTSFVFNQNLRGISVKKSNGSVFVPIEFLRNLDGSEVKKI